jgi:hypothetical protein
VAIFLAGVQKSGTTSLASHMQAHPALAAPNVKETHHFDNEALDWSHDNQPTLERFYNAWNNGRLRFDATPITIFWPPSLPRVQAHNPAAKLVLLFRDPIERAWSHWHMETRRGTENLPFSTAIREGRARLSESRPLDAHWRDHSYVERGFYGAQLQRAFSLFPREQILLLSSEQLRHKHQDTLDQLSGFLNIPSFGAVPPRQEHQSPISPDLPPVTQADHSYLQSVFAEDIKLFQDLSGLDIGGWGTMRGFAGTDRF